MKHVLKHIINKLPYVKTLHSQVKLFNKNASFPPGHFYSAIVDIDDIKMREKHIWKEKKLYDIDLNMEEQKELINIFSEYYHELPFKPDLIEGKGQNYYFNNPFYSYTDGIILYSMVRHYKPKKIIEVGSGFSSLLMLDVNQIFFNNAIKFTFIDPNLSRLKDNLKKVNNNTKIQYIETIVQDINPIYFEQLKKGDVLFIDSTHVSKCGSDVNYLLFEVLPRLNKGVLIHFHDIFYPFQYPKQWIYKGRNWNENYILRAFLMNNKNYKIKVFSHFLHKYDPNIFKKIPLAYKNEGGNLWLEKMI